MPTADPWTLIVKAMTILEGQRDSADGEDQPEQTWRAEFSRSGATIFDGDGNTVATGLTNSDARLIVTLHGTVNTQLDILRDALRALEEVGAIVYGGERHRCAFDLAARIVQGAK